MELVLLTALGVGGATIFGSLMGFVFKDISHRFSDIVLSFAAGVMLSAAILGLILPSVEYGGKSGLIITVIGIFVGAFCLNLIDKVVPHLHKLAGSDIEAHNNANLSKVLLFVREFKSDRVTGGAEAYTYLGTANYVKHQGSRPMNITWHLDRPIPAKFLKKTNKLVVG